MTEPGTAAVLDDAQIFRRLLINAATLLGAYVLPRALTFAAALVAARVLGPASFGAYGTAASYAIIVSIAATLGMLPLLVRELARAPEQAAQVLSAAHVVKLGASVLMLAVLILVAREVLHYPAEIVTGAAWLGVGYVCAAFGENLGAWFQAREQMHVWLQANLWFGLGSGLAGITLVLVTRSVPWFCAAFAFGQLAALAWLLKRMPPAVRAWSPTAFADAKRLVRATAPFAVAFFALTVFYKIDVLLLERMQPAQTVGLYAAGYKLFDVAHALAVVAAAAIYPRLSRSRAHERAAGRSLEVFLIAGALAAGGLMLMRSPITHVLFGSAYRETSMVLALLAPALIGLGINILAGYLLSVADRIGVLAVWYAVATGLKLLLAFWWIPTSGANGMAAAALASELALALGLTFSLARLGAGAPRARFGVVALTGMLAAYACTVLPGGPVVQLVVFVGASAVIYASAGVLSADERRALFAAVLPRGRTP
ncbi:MAG TPA: oligosaccharide flippase family protein [Longimicrobiales bacterium]|nr:oligosaccharide flippase family protein [Longimicrobiales bacterium]